MSSASKTFPQIRLTEHILLGLIQDEAGVAASVLAAFGVNRERVRDEIIKRITPGTDDAHLGRLPLAPLARQTIDYAMEEAQNLNHNYVSTEHLLLGLLRTREGMAARVLMETFALKIEDVREGVRQALKKSPGPGSPDPWAGKAAKRSPATYIVLEIARLERAKNEAVDAQQYERAAQFRDTIDALRGLMDNGDWAPISVFDEVIGRALEEANLAGSKNVRAEHILLALATDRSGRAAKTLESLGISLEALRKAVASLPAMEGE